MRLELARSARHLPAGPGALVAEEDAPGDCMFVVLAGACQVRCRPVVEHCDEGRPAGGAGDRAQLGVLQSKGEIGGCWTPGRGWGLCIACLNTPRVVMCGGQYKW